jgi:chorismate lyase
MWHEDLSLFGLCPKSLLHHWLTRTDSLSLAIKDQTHAFSIKLINQQLLNKYLIREVYLCANNIPWIYAQVIVPKKTYNNFKIDFDNLGEKSLGETLLFKRSDVQRSELKFLKISDYWLRKSIFKINSYPLSITEIFLPNFTHELFSGLIE